MPADHNGREFDPVLHALGASSVFPWVQCLLYFLTYLFDAHQYFSYVFTAQSVVHRCAPLTNNTLAQDTELNRTWTNSTLVHYGQCSISIQNNISGEIFTQDYPCINGMEYDRPKDVSIVSEFDLVCDREPLAGLTQTLLVFGSGLGSILWPWISDLYGRKRTVIITVISMNVASLVAGFAPGYVVFLVTKFVIGLIQPGAGLVAVTAGVELFPSSNRAIASGFFSTLFWALCIASLSPVAYLLRFYSWRILQIALCGFTPLIFIMMVFMKEPVRWLVANGKFKEAENVLKQACKCNKKDPETVLSIYRELTLNASSHPLIENIQQFPSGTEKTNEALLPTNPPDVPTTPCDTKESKDKTGEQLGFLDIFKHRILRTNSLISWFIWFVDCMTYSALYLMSGTLALDLYSGYFLNSVVEGASCVLMVILLTRCSRKVTVGTFQCMAGLCLIASSICFNFQDNSTLQIVGTVFSLLGKMGVGGAFNIIYLYIPEIFPTNIRNRALGMGMIVATAGSMLSPYSNILANYAIWAPGALFGTCSLLACLLLLFLPETKGKELPQTLQDLEAWYQVTSPDGQVHPKQGNVSIKS